MKFKTALAIVILLALGSFVVFDVIKSNKEEAIEKQLEEERAAQLEAMEKAAENEDAGLKTGDTAPDFTLNTLDGETVSLSDLRGKKVLLNFWATWCPPCEEEMPDLKKFYEDYKDEGVEVVAVNLTYFEKNIEDVQQFVEEYELTFPIPLDEKKNQKETYQAITIPTSYFLNADGVIQNKHVGPMTYEFMKETMAAME